MAREGKHESLADKVWFRPECTRDSHVLHVRRCVYYPTTRVLSIENRAPWVCILTCCEDRLRFDASRSVATEKGGASALEEMCGIDDTIWAADQTTGQAPTMPSRAGRMST